MTEPRLIGGRYQVGSLLGYGGMAEVHQATDTRLGRLVAIKILRSDLSRDPLFQTRFRREAKAAGSLNHPAIVAVYDTGEEQRGTDVVPYIVMEFVDGRTLRDILTSERRIEPNRAMEIVSEVCSALDFSHRNGIIHRDIKPANVMITRAGAVKVMDFGIARAVADSAATMTQTAAVIGTAQYLSPEQARGETVDARSDVYSTGCLLYELITGNPPFQGDSPVAVAYQHVRESAPVPSTLNPAVPRALDSIVMKALAKNPINRYQTAAEMRTDLQRALASRPVEAEPVLSDEERTQFIAATPPAPRYVPPPSPIALDEEEPDSGRRGAILWVAAVVVLLLALGGIAYAFLHGGHNNDATQDPTTTSAPPVVVLAKVPSLVGMASSTAAATLTGIQLKLAPTNVTTCASTTPTVKIGQVCTQGIAAGTGEKPGTSVPVTVLTAPAKIPVPTVMGRQEQDALSVLAAKNLQGVPTEVNSDKTKGTVINEDPAAGTPVGAGSTVTLQIANGKSRIPTDLVGKKRDDARSELQSDAQLINVKVQTVVEKTDKKEDGKVQSTDPVGGTWVDPSQTITLFVYKYKLPTCPTTATSTSTSTSTAPPTSFTGIPTGGASGTPSNTPTPTVTPTRTPTPTPTPSPTRTGPATCTPA